MSNRLKMSKSQFIIALREKGWSLTRIAQELGVHRHTVARYVDQHAKLANATDSDGPKSTQLHSGPDEPKSTKAPTGSADSRSTEVHSGSAPTSVSRSVCETLRETIEAMLDDGLSAKRIHQDLVAENGFEGSYGSAAAEVDLRFFPRAAFDAAKWQFTRGA